MAINVTYQVYTGGRWLPNVTNLTDYAGIYGSPIQGVYANCNSQEKLQHFCLKIPYLSIRIRCVQLDEFPYS